MHGPDATSNLLQVIKNREHKHEKVELWQAISREPIFRIFWKLEGNIFRTSWIQNEQEKKFDFFPLELGAVKLWFFRLSITCCRFLVAAVPCIPIFLDSGGSKVATLQFSDHSDDYKKSAVRSWLKICQNHCFQHNFFFQQVFSKQKIFPFIFRTFRIFW